MMPGSPVPKAFRAQYQSAVDGSGAACYAGILEAQALKSPKTGVLEPQLGSHVVL